MRSAVILLLACAAASAAFVDCDIPLICGYPPGEPPCAQPTNGEIRICKGTSSESDPYTEQEHKCTAPDVIANNPVIGEPDCNGHGSCSMYETQCPGMGGVDCDCVPVPETSTESETSGTETGSTETGSTETGGTDGCSGGGWGCDVVPIGDSGTISITHREATTITVTPLGPANGLECEVEVCGTALNASKPNRAFVVGFARPGPCGLCRANDPCSNIPDVDEAACSELCPDYFVPPAELPLPANGWDIVPPGGDSDLLIMCRTFFLSDIIATCPGVSVDPANGGAIEFTAYVETREQKDNCTDQGAECEGGTACCDAVTHTASQRVLVNVSDGSASLDLYPISSLNLDTHLISVHTTHDGRVCTKIATEVDEPASLGAPTLEWTPANGTAFTITPLGYCPPSGAGRECQLWRVCTDDPVVPERDEDFYANVTATFCVFAGGIEQAATAVVDLEICIMFGDDGAESDAVVITKEPTVLMCAYVGKECTERYAPGRPLIHGSCVCFEAWLEDCDIWQDTAALLLEYRYVTIDIDEGNATTSEAVYDPHALSGLPLVYRSFDDATNGTGCSLLWRQTLSVADGAAFTETLHYTVSIVEGDGGARRLLSAGSIDAQATPRAEEAEEEAAGDAPAARELSSHSDCIWGHPGCPSVAGHSSVDVMCKCDSGYEPHWDDCSDDDIDGGRWRHKDGRDDGRCRNGSKRHSSCRKKHNHDWHEAGWFLIGLLVVLVLCCLCVLAGNHAWYDSYYYPQNYACHDPCGDDYHLVHHKKVDDVCRPDHHSSSAADQCTSESSLLS